MGKNWSEQEDQILIDLVHTYGKQWGVIAQKMGTRTSSQVAARWEKCLDPKLTKGPFTPDEDALITEYVSKNGPHNWPGLSQLIKNRSAKQCRERWFNHLDPAISSSPWTSNEDAMIFDCIMKYGNKWSIISKFIPGRTDNAIKNRYNSSISKRIRVDQNGRKFLAPDLSRRQKGFNPQQIQNFNTGQVPYPSQPLPISSSSLTNLNYIRQIQPGDEQNPLSTANEQHICQTTLLPFSAQSSSSQIPNIKKGSIIVAPPFPFPTQPNQQQTNFHQTEPYNQTIVTSTAPIISSPLRQPAETITQPHTQHIQSQIPIQTQPGFASSLSSKPIPHFKREAAGMNLQPVITSCPLVASTQPQGQHLISSSFDSDQGLHVVNTLNMADNNAFPQPHLQEPSISPGQLQQPSSPTLPFSLFSPTSPLFQFSPVSPNGSFPFGSSETATPIISPNGQTNNSSANVFK